MSDCSVVAVVSGTVYPCRSHKGGKHHFAAHWPACPAPFCRLEPGHRGLHDVPAGKAEYRREAAPAAAGTQED
jgi:hypothetical protein